MYCFAVLEDSPEDLQKLRSALQAYGERRGIALQISEFTRCVDLLQIYHGQFDLLLLDIQVQQEDGVSAARKIRAMDPHVLLLFITNLAHRALDGYEVEAKAFLVKPVNWMALERYLDRALAALRGQDQGYLTLSNTRELHRVRLQDVRYLESMGHYVKVHTDQGTVIAHGTMRGMEAQLAGKPFFRCSNCCIVALGRVQSVSGNTAIVEGREIPISRARKRAFLDALNRHLADLDRPRQGGPHDR